MKSINDLFNTKDIYAIIVPPFLLHKMESDFCLHSFCDWFVLDYKQKHIFSWCNIIKSLAKQFTQRYCEVYSPLATSVIQELQTIDIIQQACNKTPLTKARGLVGNTYK